MLMGPRFLGTFTVIVYNFLIMNILITIVVETKDICDWQCVILLLKHLAWMTAIKVCTIQGHKKIICRSFV